MLSLLTLNVGATSRARAERLLAWLDNRTEDVFLLTETSGGPGTSYLLDRFRAAGHAVTHTAGTDGDRGTALISKLEIRPSGPGNFADISLPGRIAIAELPTEPAVTVLSVYVPSRDRSLNKTQKKRAFLDSFLAGLDALPHDVRDRLIIGGDYNVIPRTHQPLHRGFLSFEFAFHEELTKHGLTDAHEPSLAGEYPHSWIGKTGDGYRYDYFHVAKALAVRIETCTYLHETREHGLTDHAAVRLATNVAVLEHCMNK